VALQRVPVRYWSSRARTRRRPGSLALDDHHTRKKKVRQVGVSSRSRAVGSGNPGDVSLARKEVTASTPEIVKWLARTSESW
jgi:hypothetical protein